MSIKEWFIRKFSKSKSTVTPIPPSCKLSHKDRWVAENMLKMLEATKNPYSFHLESDLWATWQCFREGKFDMWSVENMIKRNYIEPIDPEEEERKKIQREKERIEYTKALKAKLGIT